MKIIATIFLIILTITSCKQVDSENTDAFAKAETISNTKKEEILSTIQEGYKQYGAAFKTDIILTNAEVAEKYASLKEGDTTQVTFKAPINAVCAAKGCWMRLELPEEQVFVKFKDYGFFVPTETDGGEAIVNGKAYLEEVSIEELKHMAKDGGDSPEEIAAITAPKRELRFMADGVLISGK